jgi:glycerol-3-phosphate O-acyltransferase
VIDLVANAIHSLYRQGYREIRYDQEQVSDIAAMASRYPVVFLPSHRSNLDRLALQFTLWENDLPPNHTAGGVNMDFFPVGPILRRTGVFFIRRSFRDDELYKIVLRAYIDYLVEKRFPLEWYMEGGRSRSGKLAPPRFGLLSYVVGALRRGKAEDVKLIPVSIAYDHIQDVPDYAREAQGEGKEKESLSWLLRAVRSLRRRYGNIHIRFAEPVSVAEVLDSIEDGEDESIGLQKLAFEVMHRIGRATPITPTAVVSIALLAADSAKTAEALADYCSRILDYAQARGLPMTEEARGLDVATVTFNLDWLAEHGNVSSHEALGRRVFWLSDEQVTRISYYRNMLAHFFVGRALAEMALRALGQHTPASSEIFAERLFELRDLLKFEFFFPEKGEFLAEVGEEIQREVPGWDELLASAGSDAVQTEMGPPMAYWALLHILDGYRVVADELQEGGFEDRRFLKRCLGRARMYHIEGQIGTASVSEPLFRSALSLARNRGLVDDGPDVAARRAVFAAEIKAARDLAAYD